MKAGTVMRIVELLLDAGHVLKHEGKGAGEDGPGECSERHYHCCLCKSRELLKRIHDEEDTPYQ